MTETVDPDHGVVEGGDKDPNRRDFIHIAALAATAGAVGTLAWPFVSQMNPAGDVLALAQIEVDLTRIVVGQQITVNWRGKPLFVRHRTPQEIAAARRDDRASLKDPQPDAERVKEGHSNFIVLVGTCTHLGCVPTFGGGEYRGWFCPCHGSTYDTSGRIRSGPAPSNLEVPQYSFTSDTRIQVG